MAWIFLWIVSVALTTTSAYRYSSYHPEHENQIYGASQYRREDGSLGQKTEILLNYRGRPEDIPSNQEQEESRLWNKRLSKKSIPFGYYGNRDQDQVRISPTLKDVQRHNRNASFKNTNILLRTYSSVMNRKGFKNRSRNMFIPLVSEDCEESGICENSPDYPHEYVEALLAKLPDVNIRFNLDITNPEPAQGQKLNPPSPDLSLCESEYRIIYPDKVRTKTGNWVFVVNGKNNKVQGFGGEKCIVEGEKCKNIEPFCNRYESTCNQKRTERSMWALDYNGEMVLVTAGILSCCVCELREKFPTNK